MQGTLKSQIDYLELLVLLLLENPLDLSEKDLSRDVAELRYRTEHEGLSFLTKTLPKLGKALDAGMATTKFTVPREFSQRRSKPEFMRAYFNQVFADDGSLLDSARPDAVKHLRQVLYFAYKLELPYSEEQERSVIANFCQVEEELGLPENEKEVGGLIAAASYIVRDLFEGFDPEDVIPRHGPGAVSTGEKPWEKSVFKRFYHAVNRCYPYLRYFMVGRETELKDRLEWYNGLERMSSAEAKVVLVPKDSRGPRLISCEPLELQWIQQGLGRKMMDWAERKSDLRINFRDQGVNQRLALESSISLEFSTLDLKDASDRVSVELVRRLFQHTGLFRYFDATRSTATRLPDGRLIQLSKFAPMGSALCFPVEAVCFYALCVAAVARQLGGPTRNSERRVYVYGDDLVVPTECAPSVIAALESVRLKVNSSKCCIQGPFRESCGVDAFKGVSVTPVRLRTLWTGRRSDGSAYASYIALLNQLRDRGYGKAAEYVLERLTCVYGKIPFGTENASYPCIVVDCPDKANIANAKLDLKGRWHDGLQSFQWSVLRLKTRSVDTLAEGWARLLRNVTQGPGRDPDQVVLPRSTQIKRGWASV